MNAVCKCCGSTDLNRFAAPMQGRLVFVFSWENNFISQGFGQINFLFSATHNFKLPQYWWHVLAHNARSFFK